MAVDSKLKERRKAKKRFRFMLFGGMETISPNVHVFRLYILRGAFEEKSVNYVKRDIYAIAQNFLSVGA